MLLLAAPLFSVAFVDRAGADGSPYTQSNVDPRDYIGGSVSGSIRLNYCDRSGNRINEAGGEVAVARGTDGYLYSSWSPYSVGWDLREWSPWSRLGGPIRYDPTIDQVGPYEDNRCEIGVVGLDGQIWTMTIRTGARGSKPVTSPMLPTGVLVGARPSTETFGAAEGRGYTIVARAPDGSVKIAWRYTNQPFPTNWKSLGGQTAFSPANVSVPGENGRCVAVVGIDSRLWLNCYQRQESWVPYGGQLAGPPSFAYSPESFDGKNPRREWILARGVDGALWRMDTGSRRWMSLGGNIQAAAPSFAFATNKYLFGRWVRGTRFVVLGPDGREWSRTAFANDWDALEPWQPTGHGSIVK